MARTKPLVHWTCLLALMACLQPACATDGPLIWSPSKRSDTAYDARLGVRVPGSSFTAAGVELGVHSAEKGGPVDVPVKFWGHVTAQSAQIPSATVLRDIQIRADARTGDAVAEMTARGREIVSSDLDLETSRTVTVRYDGSAAAWDGLEIHQAVKWSDPVDGVSLSAKLGALDSFSRVGAGFTLEQTLGSGAHVTARIGKAAGADLAASIKARVSVTW